MLPTVVVMCNAMLPASSVAQSTRSCGWLAQFSPDQVDLAFPNEAARYWAALLPIPRGGHIEIKGRFPHVRYLSFNTYNAQLRAVDAIADTEIVADPGSTNPFRPGARRTAKTRDYTVKIRNAPFPAGGRARNTLYNESPDGSSQGTIKDLAGFVIRVYEPDRGRDATGGVGLPDLTLVAAGGARTAVPACRFPAAGNPGLYPALAAAGSDAGGTASRGLLADDPPRWRRFTNLPALVAQLALGATIARPIGGPVIAALEKHLPSGGIGENVHNKYVFATTSTEFGAVLELRGRLPRTPRTVDGEAVMGRGQLRYWSMRTEGQATNYYACRNDDAVPTDRAGRFTVVVSTAAARPATATERCGVAWLPAGHGATRPADDAQHASAPGFREAIQRATPGAEAATMRDYLPTGRYYRRPEDFDSAHGCPVRAADKRRDPRAARSAARSRLPR